MSESCQIICCSISVIASPHWNVSSGLGRCYSCIEAMCVLCSSCVWSILATLRLSEYIVVVKHVVVFLVSHDLHGHHIVEEGWTAWSWTVFYGLSLGRERLIVLVGLTILGLKDWCFVIFRKVDIASLLAWFSSWLLNFACIDLVSTLLSLFKHFQLLWRFLLQYDERRLNLAHLVSLSLPHFSLTTFPAFLHAIYLSLTSPLIPTSISLTLHNCLLHWLQCLSLMHCIGLHWQEHLGVLLDRSCPCGLLVWSIVRLGGLRAVERLTHVVNEALPTGFYLWLQDRDGGGLLGHVLLPIGFVVLQLAFNGGITLFDREILV